MKIDRFYLRRILDYKNPNSNSKIRNYKCKIQNKNAISKILNAQFRIKSQNPKLQIQNL